MLSEYLETSSSLAEFSPLRVMAAASAIFLKPAIICSGFCGSGGISPLGVSGPPNSVFIRSAKIFACSLQNSKVQYRLCNVTPYMSSHHTYTKNASGSSPASPPASLTLLASAVDAFSCLLPPLGVLSKSCSASENGAMLVLLYKAQMEQLSIHLQRILTVQQVVQIVSISIWLLLRHSVELCDENEILLLEKLCNTSCFGLKQSVCANGWVCVRGHDFLFNFRNHDHSYR